jgi:anti-sigma factor RsiW
MSCAETVARLDAFVDGDLDEAGFQELEAHLAECGACRAQERRSRALLAEAAALPRALAPARDLWPGIAARIAADARPASRPAWRRPWTLAAAAAIALLASSVAIRPRSEPPRSQASAGRVAGIAVPAAAGLAPDLEQAEVAYARAASDLRGALESEREALAPGTLRILDQNLRAIDAALDEIRAALAKDPTNSELVRMLQGAHKRKLELLQRVARLT